LVDKSIKKLAFKTELFRSERVIGWRRVFRSAK
jgi:hypothetical protein